MNKLNNRYNEIRVHNISKACEINYLNLWKGDYLMKLLHT